VRGRLVLAVAVTVFTPACQAIEARPDGDVADVVASTVPAATAEWVLGGPELSMYLRWTATGEQIQGVGQIAERGAGGSTLDVRSEALTGAVNGGQIVVTAGAQTWSGSLSAEALALGWARRDGTRAEVTMVPGSAADFDAAVASMREQLPSTSVATTPATDATETTAVVTTTPPTATTPATTIPIAELTFPDGAATDLQAAIVELGDLQESENLAAIAAALDAMDALADEVGGDDCAALLIEVAAVQEAGTEVEQRLRALESQTADVQRQRDAVNLLTESFEDGGGTDETLLTASTEARAGADRFIDYVEGYGGDVRSVVEDTVVVADAEFANC